MARARPRPSSSVISIHSIEINYLKQRSTPTSEKEAPPQCVADRLIRNHLDLKQQDGALLLLDSDIELSSKLQTTLQKRNVTVIQSNPVCLEGLFLEILESSVPKNKRNNAIKLKQHFQITYLKTDRQSEYTAKLKQACPKLFPLELIESQRGKNTTLDTILSFIRV